MISCLHCSRASNKEFCCLGCETAYQIINKSNLSKYYKFRIKSEKEKNLKPENFSKIDCGNFIIEDNKKTYSIYLLVKGLYCGACIWLIENILRKQKNIISARVNLSHQRLKITWKNNRNEINNFIKSIVDLGYKLIPFDFENYSKLLKKQDNQLLKAMAVAAFSFGNIMLISIGLWVSTSETMGIITRNLLYWVSAIIALPTIIYCGRFFFKEALNAILHRRSSMDIAISVAIILVSALSFFEIKNYGEHAYFDSVIMLIFFLITGRYLDLNAKRNAFSLSYDLEKLNLNRAILIKDSKYTNISTRDIKKNMILLVPKGEKISADGVISEGISEVDNALVTGESKLQEVKVGDNVFAGTTNISNSIKIRVEKDNNENLLSQIIKLVEEGQRYKGKYTEIAEKISSYYTPLIHILAIATFSIWYFFLEESFRNSLIISVSLLIITCPCALALATPSVNIRIYGFLLKRGIILKSSKVIEQLKKIKIVVFDKTGTLTKENLKLVHISDKDGGHINETERNFYIKLAASMAIHSTHPVSQALVNEYKGKIFNLDVKEIANLGLISNYNNSKIKLGKREFVNSDFDKKHQEFTKIYLRYKNDLIIFYLENELRDNTERVIKELKKDKKVIIVSGDEKSSVRYIANKLDIKDYYHSCDPVKKYKLIQKLKKQSTPLLMVGDGINDAPSLSFSDISISFFKASDISKNVSDIILCNSNLLGITEIFKASKKFNLLIKQNFIFALIYNLLAITLAIMGFVTPLIAAFSMSTSSLIVILNSLRLK